VELVLGADVVVDAGFVSEPVVDPLFAVVFTGVVVFSVVPVELGDVVGLVVAGDEAFVVCEVVGWELPVGEFVGGAVGAWVGGCVGAGVGAGEQPVPVDFPSPTGLSAGQIQEKLPGVLKHVAPETQTPTVKHSFISWQSDGSPEYPGEQTQTAERSVFWHCAFVAHVNVPVEHPLDKGGPAIDVAALGSSHP